MKIPYQLPVIVALALLASCGGGSKEKKSDAKAETESNVEQTMICADEEKEPVFDETDEVVFEQEEQEESISWDEYLDEMEQVVKQYESYANSLSSGKVDLDALTNIAERAEELTYDIEEVSLSSEQHKRYMNLTTRISNAATKAASASMEALDMDNLDLTDIDLSDFGF